MAEPDLTADLVDAYVARLRRSLRWRRDVDDVLAEVEDHLREGVFRLCLAGAEPRSAQERVLQRFGEPGLVIRSFAVTSSGGLAMPTRLTRTAGLLALASAALFALAGASVVIGQVADPAGASWESWYLVWTVLSALATAAAVAGLAGALARSGGLRGWLPGVVVVSGVAAVAACVAGTWMFPLWGGLLSLAAALTALRLRAAGPSTGVRPSPLDWVLATAWPAGFAFWYVVDRLQVGPVDAWGDVVLAVTGAVVVATVLLVAGLVRLGRWLAGEVPAATPRTVAPA